MFDNGVDSLGCLGRDLPYRSRRDFLQRSSLGFGWLAYSSLNAQWARCEEVPSPHFKPRAKRVIFLFMDGGVSHVDSFDPKPELTKRDGQPVQWKQDPLSQAVSANRKWLGSPWLFSQYGQCGTWVSDLFPYITRVVDELCIVRSVVGETPLHGAQSLLLHTGRSIAAAPSIGSWITYGLGCENQELPGYVLLNNDWIPNGGFQNFASSFLPASFQATMVRAKGTPVDNIVPAEPRSLQSIKLQFLKERDRLFGKEQGDSESIESSIRNYEIAAAMQSNIPDLCDVSNESAETLALYGVDRKDPFENSYALQCLRARRLAEAGVRFIEITCPNTHANNSPWDQHGQLRLRHGENARITDQPVTALLVDLKRRGLLDDTLVVWAGEMGRTPHSAGNDGRDHHVGGYSIWMAGGGVRGGQTFGATDEMGMSATENKIDIHDLHATILYLLGLDHEQLTFRFGGRDMRLTDVSGNIVKAIVT